jgi:glucose-1-phosphate thymidylyltransferase
MIKISGKRLIDHVMDKIKEAFPEKTEICFIIGYKKEIITQHIEKVHSNYFNISFIEQTPVRTKEGNIKLSGLGDAISLAKDFGNSDDCCIILCDRLPTDGFLSLLKYAKDENTDGILNVTYVDDPEKYGICVLNDEGYVSKIIEKPTEYLSNLAVSGAYLIKKKIIDDMFKLSISQSEKPYVTGQEHNFSVICQHLIDSGAKFKVNLLNNPVLDFGNINKFIVGSKYLINEESRSNKYNYIKHSSKNLENTVVNPIYIGEDTTCKGTKIGPNVSLGKNSQVENCIISNSVIGENSNLKNLTITNTLVGDGTTNKDFIRNSIKSK